MPDPQTTIQQKLRSEFLWRDTPLKDMAYQAADKIDRLERLIHAILHADERGQGINFYEAMKAAAKETHYNEA